MVTFSEVSEEIKEEPEASQVEEAPPTTTNAQEHEEPSAEGWNELMGKDLMMRTLEPSPDENAMALQHQDLVQVSFVGRAAATPNDENGPIFHQAEDWWVVVGDKDVIPALEMGIRFASVGESFAVWCKAKYAYGLSTRSYEKGDFELPPESDVRYDVKVKQIATSDERTKDHLKWTLIMGESKKNIGNDAYANEWSDGHGKARIKYIYEKTAKEMELVVDVDQPQDMDDETKEMMDKAKSILIDCLNNVTAVLLRDKEYKLAKEAAVKVLQRDPDNFKGLIRAAKAALLDPSSSFEEVDLAIAAAAEKAQGVQEQDLMKLKKDFQRRKQAYEQKSKAMYSKALGGDKSAAKEEESKEDTTLAPKDSATGQEEEEEATATATATTTAAAADPADPATKVEKKPFSWSDRSTWPWSTILAYAFQLSMPFVMWTVAQQFRVDRSQVQPAGGFSATMPPAPPESDPLHEEF